MSIVSMDLLSFEVKGGSSHKPFSTNEQAFSGRLQPTIDLSLLLWGRHEDSLAQIWKPLHNGGAFNST